MQRLFSLLAITALASSLGACASKTAGYTGGTVLSVAGSALLIGATRDDCLDGDLDESVGCAYRNIVTGTAGATMLAIGAGILLVTAATADPTTEADTRRLPPPRDVRPPTPAPPVDACTVDGCLP